MVEFMVKKNESQALSSKKRVVLPELISEPSTQLEVQWIDEIVDLCYRALNVSFEADWRKHKQRNWFGGR